MCVLCVIIMVCFAHAEFVNVSISSEALLFYSQNKLTVTKRYYFLHSSSCPLECPQGSSV